MASKEIDKPTSNCCLKQLPKVQAPFKMVLNKVRYIVLVQIGKTFQKYCMKIRKNNSPKCLSSLWTCFDHIRQLFDKVLHIRNIGKRRHSIYLCYQIPFIKFLHSLVSTEVNKSSLCDESETFRFMPTSPACPHVNSGKPLLFPPGY